MASDVDLCNMALSHVGSDAVVSSINPVDGSVEAGHCARFFRLARTEMLDSFPWAWSKKRVALTELDTNPSNVWSYAYGLPADMLNPTRILRSSVLTDFGFFPFYGFVTFDEMAVFNERGTADFDIEGGALLTNEPDAILLYTQDVIDTSKWSPLFNVSFSYLLASFLAGPLIKGEAGATTAGKLRQIATNLAKTAMARDANGGAEPSFDLASSIRVRQ